MRSRMLLGERAEGALAAATAASSGARISTVSRLVARSPRKRCHSSLPLKNISQRMMKERVAKEEGWPLVSETSFHICIRPTQRK